MAQQKTLQLLNTVNVTKDEFVTAMKDSVGEQTLQRLVLTKVLEGSIEDAKSLKQLQMKKWLN